ncbi:MAG: hypothetical protein ACJAR2_000778 [Ilumatobacter sp.]|jgi:hypothetical protein
MLSPGIHDLWLDPTRCEITPRGDRDVLSSVVAVEAAVAFFDLDLEPVAGGIGPAAIVRCTHSPGDDVAE